MGPLVEAWEGATDLFKPEVTLAKHQNNDQTYPLIRGNLKILKKEEITTILVSSILTFPVCVFAFSHSWGSTIIYIQIDFMFLTERHKHIPV